MSDDGRACALTQYDEHRAVTSTPSQHSLKPADLDRHLPASAADPALARAAVADPGDQSGPIQRTHLRTGNASAELLGQRDDDALGAADVAEPIAVLVLLQLADQFGAMGMQAGKDVLDVFEVWLRDVTAGGRYLDLHRVSEPKQVMLRVHLGVAPFAADDHAAEVERLRAVGARAADAGQTNVRWVVLTDPEGNELSVLTPR